MVKNKSKVNELSQEKKKQQQHEHSKIIQWDF